MNKPKLHVTPIKNWMNDPNGFIYYHNKYHLFYQYFPYETKWGTMHWGHLVSDDLVHFKDLGIAIYPSKDYDRNGCFSGSAIEIDDQMVIYYTAIYYDQLNPEDIHRTGNKIVASQAMLVSPDGFTLDNNKKVKIIDTITDETIGHPNNTRDPKVFYYNDRYYMVLGTQINKHGRVLVYQSMDGFTWELMHCNDDSRFGTMLECPDLYQSNGQWIMTLSPENMLLDGINYPSHCLYALVDFDEKTGKIDVLKDPAFIDLGLDFYAAQTTKDEYGQTVIIGWMRMPEAVNGWIGMFTFPRVIEYKNDHVYFHIHSHIDQQFTTPCETIDDENAYKISVDVQEGSTLNIAGMTIEIKDHSIHTDRSKVFTQASKLFNSESPVGTSFKTPAINGNIHLDIYLDKNIIEIYVNDGYYVLSNIIYRQTNELSIQKGENLCILTTN